ncbi:glycerol-3-phosphate dehydrogenase [Hyphomicrobium sp.]|uniref:glycerol-3-phosphate dehydrogenase n=1 Tax=Hyphomicrobium sp. TaxID=82 RepID=UPI002D78115C|nr:glycerol-3-phosphate dehydrogenase [Hyphomicrobium sp.]HET6388919.1 glycerol-3-phosphate dehydrogenase [Hyphomicrobium sp.]
MADQIYDLLVIGGGINGAGIAADAAMRGLSVFLAEAEDLGGATSSASSKLIHGGLRYLEHFEFRLVREALGEREVLLAKAPHIIRPMRFVLPQDPGMRSELMMRAGLFLYDHLATRKSLGASHAIDLRRDPAGAPLKHELTRGFTYWDCAVDDSRLVVLNAIGAREAGARIETQARVTGLKIENGIWTAALNNSARSIAARAVVNAAGPWIANVAALAESLQHAPRPTVRLVKGSHIVVPRVSGAGDAYTFQNRDGRIVFALPYEQTFTLIGTTEEAFAGNPRNAAPSREEEDYLLEAANRFFRHPLTRGDIVWSFAGVRPLDDEDGNENASAVSRDYRLEFHATNTPPLLHVVGGKITTYRKLAEAALKFFESYFPKMRGGSTRTSPLPGGNLGGRTFDQWFEAFARENSRFDALFLRQLARRHGTRASKIIAGAASAKDLGEDFGGGLTAREVAYLKSEEWAKTAGDVLWRRTKIGLHLAPDERTRVAGRVQACLDKS